MLIMFSIFKDFFFPETFQSNFKSTMVIKKVYYRLFLFQLFSNMNLKRIE